MFKKILTFGVVSLAISQGAHAQIIPNNSYAQTLMNGNAMLQSSLGQIIATQGARNASGGAPSNYCSPLPPADLQRGADGHVPPELQGDPRYQAWLHCQGGQSAPPGNAQGYATPPVANHLPVTATDFTPAMPGHPFVDRFLQSQPLTGEQRGALRGAFDEMSSRIARESRPNNLAAAMTFAICGAIYLIDNSFTDADTDRYYAAINDRLGSSPVVAQMSALQKQNLSDAMIMNITVAKLLADLGQSDPQVRVQSVQYAQGMLVELTGSPTGRLAF